MDFKHDLIFFEFLLYFLEKIVRKKKNVLVNGGSKIQKIITALFYVSGHSGHFLKRFIFLGHLNLYLFFRGCQLVMMGNYELKTAA